MHIYDLIHPGWVVETIQTVPCLVSWFLLVAAIRLPSLIAATMPLLPLEFVDCLSDSPYFRENLHAHEKELESTSSQIKVLIKQVNQLLEAAKGRLIHLLPMFTYSLVFSTVLSRAQRNLANTLSNFTFEVIGNERTDDEIVIGKCK